MNDHDNKEKFEFKGVSFEEWKQGLPEFIDGNWEDEYQQYIKNKESNRDLLTGKVYFDTEKCAICGRQTIDEYYGNTCDLQRKLRKRYDEDAAVPYYYWWLKFAAKQNFITLCDYCFDNSADTLLSQINELCPTCGHNIYVTNYDLHLDLYCNECHFCMLKHSQIATCIEDYGSYDRCYPSCNNPTICTLTHSDDEKEDEDEDDEESVGENLLFGDDWVDDY